MPRHAKTAEGRVTGLLGGAVVLVLCASAAGAADRGLMVGSSYAIIDKGCQVFPKPAEVCPSIYAYPAKLVVIHDSRIAGDVVYEFEVKGQDLISISRIFVREVDIPYGRYRR